MPLQKAQVLLVGHKSSTRQCQEESDGGAGIQSTGTPQRIPKYGFMSSVKAMSVNQRCCELRPKLSSTQDRLLGLKIVNYLLEWERDG